MIAIEGTHRGAGEMQRVGGAGVRADDEQAAILLVDDNEANLVALQEILSDLGPRLVCARSGEDALRRVLAGDFAVILLDVLMPGLDGYETAALIRARERSRHVPIIFLTAISKDSSDLSRGYSAGAVDYVFKPVEPLILRSKVSVFIELHNKAREIRRQAEQERRLLAENFEVRLQQMRTAEELARSRAQQALMIDALPIALYAASRRDGFQARRFVGSNPERLCGYPARHFARSRTLWLSRIHEDDRATVVDGLRRAERSGSFSAEYRWRCESDEYRWFSDRGVVTGGEDGTADEMFGVWLDISERRSLEQRLTHAQKLEAVGQMTGGIAHDFNNMLTVIIGSLRQTARRAEGDARQSRYIDLALQAAQSCADLTRRLLGFSRQQALEPRRLSLVRQVELLAGLLERVLGERISVTVAFEDDLWTVHVDPSQLESSLMNLAINARDAMPQGGTLTIGARNLTLAGREGGDIADGDYVELVVADTGTGMPDAVRERAFEPFFTTKDPGRGTGLGLSTIYGFIRQSGGTVRIDSEIGRGTAIRLYLPRAQGDPELLDAAPPPDPASLSGKVVLVVEDDEKVREIAASMLADLGCRPVEAADGDAALRRLAEEPDIQLLFTDCVMPGTYSGPSLAAEVARTRPDLPVLFTSAYQEMGEAGGAMPVAARLLPKPYSSEQLAAAIASVLPVATDPA